ncbi:MULTISPECIES: sporulation protein [unclassified Bacillus (in: firmicutes)]|uniref:sporulation protein n=1 Tax=unclassified Bacillus (in: firmicutes) TaxID=185979 RepID=UPI0008DF03AD|nr:MULTISPECIES: sporulation protein [unclassified Bacillus (in: firmicutes)]SFA92009.1 sporulation-control protein [Bacillus sp. UNCCL13]SFQ85754.1 sporulation-control protein [Bacillus sp. cl95]
MSFFDKVFASVGIGSATVDTKLEKATYFTGENVRGVVEIKGGKTEQKVDEIYLSLNTTYIKESDDKKYTVSTAIERFRLTEAFTIRSGEKKEIPFSFQLPDDTPISLGRTKIWVQTGLDIKNAVDPGDKDFINVIPNNLMSAVFSAVDNLGFRMREADCQEASYKLRGRLPFVQEFEFIPVAGSFRGKLDEIEIVFRPLSNQSTEVLLQIDRRARGLGGFLSEAMEMDETNVRFTVSNPDVNAIQQQLLSVLNKYS